MLLRPAPGKCSHGGAGDLTSTALPRGGIHKDLPHADNTGIFNQAVNTATFATLDLLEDIRAAAGDNDFLRYDAPRCEESSGWYLYHSFVLAHAE